MTKTRTKVFHCVSYIKLIQSWDNGMLVAAYSSQHPFTLKQKIQSKCKSKTFAKEFVAIQRQNKELVTHLFSIQICFTRYLGVHRSVRMQEQNNMHGLKLSAL